MRPGQRRHLRSAMRPGSPRWVALAVSVALAACGLTTRSSEPAADRPHEVVVFAAASLTEAFADIADAYMATHPGSRVVVNAAGSQTLAHQIIRGAPADVFASADAAQMARVADAGHLAGPAATFASNELMIAVAPGNPLGVEHLSDLEDPRLVVVLPAEQVPAGVYAREALAAAGVVVDAASLEVDVRAALSRVALGEADAAIVYASDVAAAGARVEGVRLPAGVNVSAAYRIATLSTARDPVAAQALVDLVLAEDGQELLAEHGLGAP